MDLKSNIKQRWKSIGQIYNGQMLPGYSYASVPVCFFLDDRNLRIFFSARNSKNESMPFFLDYDLSQNKIVEISNTPLLNSGNIGCFDDSGVMPTCLIQKNNELWLYYIGWNLGVTVPFRNSLGLAISADQGKSFKRLFDGPILDRTAREPHFNASACVLQEMNIWKMWYLSCVKWELINGKPQHYYHIKYAESNDGIMWERNGTIAIDFKYKNEYAISVPRVINEGNIYKMWYSYRGGPYSENYKMGYAESTDGITWNRMDDCIEFSGSDSQWDTEMQCYPCIFDYNNERYMLYNGNGYGKTGFGLAKLQSYSHE